LYEVKIAINLWLETAKNEGRHIPSPECKEILLDMIAKKGEERAFS
jgi:predicted RNase H-like HicB family nuclease